MRAGTLRPLRALVAVLAAGSLVLGACSGDDDASEEGGGPPSQATVPPEDTFRMGVTSLDHLDPAYVLPSDQAGMVAMDLLFDGLTEWDPETGVAVPSLAERWETDDSRLLWTFHLRPDATFSDGSPITAGDVKFSLERLARMGNLSLAGVRLEDVAGYEEFVGGAAEGIAGIAAFDDSTLVIGLRSPREALPELLSSPLFGVVPRAVVEADPFGFDEAPVGSGPFRFESSEGAGRTAGEGAADGGESAEDRAGDAVDQDAAPDPAEGAEGPSGDGPGSGGEVARLVGREGRTSVGIVTISTYESSRQAYQAFLDGGLDWSVVPPDELAEAGERFGRDAMVPFDTQLLLGFDLSDPEMADPRFRIAISKAVDRGALLSSPLVGARALGSLVPDTVPGSSTDGCGDVCAHDPDAARALVAEVFPDGTVPPVKVDVYDDPLERSMGERVVASLVEVGIPAELVVRSYEEHLSALASGDVQVFSFSWVAMAPDPSEYLDPLFLSDSPDNVSGLADPLADLAIRTARAEPDRALRIAQYADIDRLVSGLVPMVPIAVHQTPVVVADRVEGFTPHPDGTFDAASISLSDGRS